MSKKKKENLEILYVKCQEVTIVVTWSDVFFSTSPDIAKPHLSCHIYVNSRESTTPHIVSYPKASCPPNLQTDISEL